MYGDWKMGRSRPPERLNRGPQVRRAESPAPGVSAGRLRKATPSSSQGLVMGLAMAAAGGKCPESLRNRFTGRAGIGPILIRKAGLPLQN